jgi:hypothetical protein
VDDYYENAGFDLTCDFDKVKEAQIEMDSPYYEDGYIDEDYFISKGFTLSITVDNFTNAVPHSLLRQAYQLTSAKCCLAMLTSVPV